jgi:preprotein translocase subunit SecY
MILDTLKSIVSIKDLRKKIIATLLLVLVFKFLSVIPIPGVDNDGLSTIIE